MTVKTIKKIERLSMPDETLDKWLDERIKYAESEVGMNRSYRHLDETAIARLAALREVRDKITELWGV